MKVMRSNYETTHSTTTKTTPSKIATPGTDHSKASRSSVRKTPISFAGVVTLLLFIGCARFHTNQVEQRFENGQLAGIIQTKVGTTTFFDSKSALANFKAMQTEKTQSAIVGALNQEANGTNAIAMLNALANLVAAMPK